MALNAAALATIDLLTTGKGDPLAPEHIEVTRVSFPLLLDSVFNVIANNEGGTLYTTWVNAAGQDGFQRLERPVSRPTPSKWALLRMRILRAWDVLLDRE